MTTFYSVSNGNLVQAADANQYYSYMQTMLTYRARVYLNFQENIPARTDTRILVNTPNTGMDPAGMLDPFNNGLRIPAAGIWRVTGRAGYDATTAQTLQISGWNAPSGGGGASKIALGTVGTFVVGQGIIACPSYFSELSIFGVGDLFYMTVFANAAFSIGPDVFVCITADYLGPTS